MKILMMVIVLGFGSLSLAQDPTWGEIELRADLYFMRDQEMARGDDIAKVNQQIFDLMSTDVPVSSGERAMGITYSQAELMMKNVYSNVVTGWRGISKYDPDGVRGFCFGRALCTHLDLLRYGVAKDSIRKVFVVGPMNVSGIKWQFHVATLVKAADSPGWYALDMVVGKPVSLEMWFSSFNEYSTDQKLRLYVTNPQKLGASGWEYNRAGLSDPFYNNYFKDLFEYFRKNRIAEEKKFNQSCAKIFGF